MLVRPGPAAQPRRPEILRLVTATAIYGGGGNFLRLATAYELYGGLRRRLGGLCTAQSTNPTLFDPHAKVAYDGARGCGFIKIVLIEEGHGQLSGYDDDDGTFRADIEIVDQKHFAAD